MWQTFEDGYNSSDYRIYDRNYTREETGDLVTDSGSGEEDAALALGSGDGGLPLSSSRDTSAPLGTLTIPWTTRTLRPTSIRWGNRP